MFEEKVHELKPKLSKRFRFGKLNEKLNTVPLRHFKYPTLVFVSHDSRQKHNVHYKRLHIPMEARNPHIHLNDARRHLSNTITSKMILDLIHDGRTKHVQ